MPMNDMIAKEQIANCEAYLKRHEIYLFHLNPQ